MIRRDPLELLLEFHDESSQRINLVPSENQMSMASRISYLTDAYSRYSFGDSATENDAWPGRRNLASIEEGLIADLGALYGATHANVRAVSGINCMAIALSAFSEPGGTVLSIGERDGGHGSTSFIGRRLGLDVRELPIDPATTSIDLEILDASLPPERSDLVVYLDQFMCLFPHDLIGLRAVVGQDAVIHYDGSHVLGLIAGGEFQDPLREGASSLGGSTHKTLPGPHKGIFLTQDPRLHAAFALHASHFVSHHHGADVVALAIAIRDLMADEGRYASQTVANARHFGRVLADRGIAVCYPERDFTRSHQLWIDVSPIMPAARASLALFKAGVVVNAIPLPHVTADRGLRIGVQEITRLGFDDAAMEALADVFERVLIERVDPELVAPAVGALLAAHDGSRRTERNAIEAITALVRSSTGRRR